jgi:N-acetylglucosaminyldiphosphoundecaprenol N-acetyl-beta-D-mannosaminyltransferase
MTTEIIFNIKISFTSYEEIIDAIQNAFSSKRKIAIFYANAHTVRLSRRDPSFPATLNSSDITFNDGFGIYMAHKILSSGKTKKKAFNWTDCGYRFIRMCEERGWKIFFCGSSSEILKLAADNLKKEYPGLNLCGILNGYDESDSKDCVEIINRAGPDILWVGMGSPKQERWIESKKGEINCRIIQSVGDLFSLFAGKKVRGPKFIRRVGLEWLARTFAHPLKYCDRYLIGIPIFIFLIIKEKVNRKDGIFVTR